MRRRFLPLLAFAALLALPRLGHAQITAGTGSAAGDDTQATTVGAVIFYDYTYTKAPKVTDAAGNSISPSAFNLVRTYINIQGRISHVVSYRITPDISRLGLSGNGLDGSLLFRVKYGFAQFALDDWTGKWKQTWVRVGVQQTPYIDSQEGIYRYRFQGTLFGERDGGLSSSDAGVSFHTNIPNSYGDFHVGIYNGEGYAKAEANNQQAVMVRGTLRPMPAGGALARTIKINAFYVGDHVVRDAERMRMITSATVEQPHFNMGIEYLKKTDQTLPTAAKVNADGISFFLTPVFKTKGAGPEALIRVDSYRPNTSNKDARQTRVIAGLAYWFAHPAGNATAAWLLDYEQITYKNISSPKQQKVTLHGLINF